MRFLCRFAGMMDGISEQVTCHETKDRFICEMMIRNPHVPIPLTRKIGWRQRKENKKVNRFLWSSHAMKINSEWRHGSYSNIGLFYSTWIPPWALAIHLAILMAVNIPNSAWFFSSLSDSSQFLDSSKVTFLPAEFSVWGKIHMF